MIFRSPFGIGISISIIMLETILDSLNLAFRQKEAIYRIGEIVENVFSSGFSFKKIFAVFIAIMEMFGCVIFDNGLTPMGDELNLEGYELVFCDEFDGTELDTENWYYRECGERRGGYNSGSQIAVKDGNMVITGEYLKDGEFGAGWYVGMVCMKQGYTRGYFECRAIASSGGDFWSAFWLQPDHPYEHDISKGGIGGAEIDIMEANNSGEINIFKKNAVTQTIHCNGGDDNPDELESCILGKFNGNNIYEEYNTYGVEWTEDEYIFYINGVETARSSWYSGVSEAPGKIMLAIEIPEDIGFDINSGYRTEFKIDYVKIWQKNV